MADKLETIQILFVKRNARKRGRTSSDDYNDMIDELAHDLAAFNTQWNNRLVSLTSTIPDGTDDSTVDAYTNGLSGKHLYVDASATSTNNTIYYNTSASRPFSVLEQFANVYTEIQTVRNELSADIQSSLPTAEEIIIADAGGNYDSTNVEDALAEVMVAIHNVSTGALDLSEVAQNYIPLNDVTWDIGTTIKRIRKIYVGPSSLHVKAIAALGETPSNKDYALKVEASTGKLQITDDDSAVTVVKFDTSNSSIQLGSNSKVASSTDGYLTMLNSSDDGFEGLKFGGSTTSYPAIMTWSTNEFYFMLADESDYTNTYMGNTYVSSINAHSKAKILFPVDGQITLRNYATDDFNLLQFGGATSAYPALKRSGTTIQVRLADDSGNATLEAATLAATTVNATNVSVSGQITGSVTVQNNLELGGQLYSTIPTTHIPTGTTETIDWNSGNAHVLDLASATGNVTLTLNNGNAGASYLLKIIQGATTRDIVWPGTVLWPDGIAPTISPNNDEVDIVSMFFDGTNYYASIGQNFN